MESIISERLTQFAQTIGPASDSVIEEMDVYAETQSFPTVGPAVGGWLFLLARLTAARSVFEFGSGFGYSAYWFARALPEDGQIVLTERNAANLDRAREYLARGGYLDHAIMEQGDALETIERFDGPFDIVLIDNEKHRYRAAFDAVRDKIASNGLLIADNAVTAGSIDFDSLADLADGCDVEATKSTHGIAEYLAAVASDPAFETTLLPLGEGVAVSHKQ